MSNTNKNKKDVRKNTFLMYLFIYGIIVFILGIIFNLFVLINIGFSTILSFNIIFLIKFIKNNIRHNKCIKCKKNKKIKKMDKFDSFNPKYCRKCNTELAEDLTLDNPIHMKDFM